MLVMMVQILLYLDHKVLLVKKEIKVLKVNKVFKVLLVLLVLMELMELLVK